jgi:glycosyltransferase involved in cell wall biosynthesis
MKTLASPGDRPPITYAMIAVAIVLDLLFVVLAYHAAYWIRFDPDELRKNYHLLTQSLPVLLVFQSVSLLVVGAYRWRWSRPLRFADLYICARGIVLGTASSILFLLYVYRFQSYSRVVFIAYSILLFLLVIGSRAAYGRIADSVARRQRATARALIYGAGDNGALLARELRRTARFGYRPVGFIDDDAGKDGNRIAGLKVVGGVADLIHALDRYNADTVILSTKAIRSAHLRTLARICDATGTPVVTMRFGLEPIDISGGVIQHFPAPVERGPLPGPAVAMFPATARDGQRPAERLRVAHVVTRLNFGGVTRHILNLHRNFPSDRVEMRIITGTVATGEEEWVEAIREAGVVPWTIPELRRPVAPIHDLVATYRLWRLFRRWKPHVVHTHMSKAGAVGRVAALLAGVPVTVRSFHGHPFHTHFGSIGSWGARVFERTLCRLTTGIITVTAGQHDEIVRQLAIVSEDRTRTISYGCQPDGPASPQERASSRQQLGIDRAAFVVVSVGRLTAIKNPALVLQALARCPEPVIAVLAGDGELRGGLEDLAKTLGVAGRTIFPGRVEDANAIYRAADVVALTSRAEGAPIAIMEAMGCALPVIATSVGGVPDLLDPSCGILINDGDADALAAVLTALARDPARVERMGRAAHARALVQFSVEREAASVLGYYEALLAAERGESVPPYAVGSA